MDSGQLSRISPAILISSGRTGRSLSVWILVLTMVLIALPVPAQAQDIEGAANRSGGET